MKEKNTYVIYFDLFGKSYKTSVIANSKEQAQQIVKDKIVFVNVIKKSNVFVTDKNV
jgi:hypothetical protein